MTAHRLNLFYGSFGFFALSCLYFVRGRLTHPLVGPLAGAAIATFVGLNFLRAGMGTTHIFQFSKDDLVILPVIVFALGVAFDAWRQASKRAHMATTLILIGWIGWGAVWLSRDIRGRFIRPDYPPPAASTAVSFD